MSNFMNALKNEIDEASISITENGAVGYRTQGSKLVDLNFATSSMRHMGEREIYSRFMDAYYENPMLVMKWLFYMRDVREGLGERRSFRAIMNYLTLEHEDIAIAVLQLIPEYGRWDDLICLMDCNNANVANMVLAIIKKQLNTDILNVNLNTNRPISLLAKWIPSENASSSETKRKAKIIREYLGLTPREYRKTLSRLRKYLDVVECKMSAKNWSEINYTTVPSKANLNYNNAFLKNDTERRKKYLESLKKGEVKINAGVLFPHDIVHKYADDCFWSSRVKPYDETLEQLWKNLKNIGNIENTMVVADGSGSMTMRVDNSSKVTALDVANALAIYCGERCQGEFANKYITFSSRPQLVDFTNAKSLKDKLEIALRHNEVANTNIEAVFDLILTTAKNNNMSQDEIPQNVLIISDMEFDGCARCGNGQNKVSVNLFKEIEKRYNEAGYKLPRLVFWNVNSRTGTIPVRENDMGVALVSGFSTNVLNMVMNGELDPYKCLVKELNKERYAPVDDAVRRALKKLPMMF